MQSTFDFFSKTCKTKVFEARRESIVQCRTEIGKPPSANLTTYPREMEEPVLPGASQSDITPKTIERSVLFLSTWVPGRELIELKVDGTVKNCNGYRQGLKLCYIWRVKLREILHNYCRIM
ncbi:hypothetical protein J6590_078645 [Homalodisca vitripennis]|nr:hypothetical protein J6590_078645 [Homalodisca vitripennis]